MPKLTIYQGLPASGKSTLARELVTKTGNTKRVNKDDIRATLDNSKWSKANEKFVIKTRNFIIEEALKDGFNVVSDDTNFHPNHIEAMKEIAAKYKATVEVKFVDTPLDECIRRDKLREASVGEKVIKGMYNQYLKPPKVVYSEKNTTLEHVFLCDIDGTVALTGDRSIYDWDKVEVDLPNVPVISIVNSMLKKGQKIIFMSGRDSVCREKTLSWIEKNINIKASEIQLFMRKEADVRKDTVVKKELFEAHIRSKYIVDFVLDDRPSVCRMWRDELGLYVIQVGDPYVEF
jgi:predicted kinase